MRDFGIGKHVDSENGFMSGIGILRQSHHENESFQRLDILDTDLGVHRWESCHFEKCNFSNSRLGSNSFVNCTFTDCDLSNVTVASASFVSIVFIRCKMLGIKWTEAKQLLFSITLESCNISFNNFFGMKLKKIKMFDCRAEGAIFSEANMSGANLQRTNFKSALFENTTLVATDFSDATDYDIDVLNNKVKNAIFTLPDAVRLLRSLDIKVQ
jgi:fluoroquinolone resistance protein